MPKSQLVPTVEEVMTPAVILSSKDRHWQGIEVMQARLDFNELIVPALASHTLVLNLAQPFNLQGQLEGYQGQQPMYKGAAKLIPAVRPSQWQWANQIELNLLHLSLDTIFTTEIITQAGLNPDRLELIATVGVTDPQLEQIGLALLTELYNRGLAGKLYTEALTQLLVVHLIRYYSSLGSRSKIAQYRGPLSTKALELITEYIEANLAQELHLKDLAALVNLSPYYFSRLFKQTTGLAPHQYVIRSRVEKAKTLLISTTLSLQEIATRVGFTDQSHLTRHFRTLTGVTPSALRRG